MRLSKSLEGNMDRIFKCINSCDKMDQLENAGRMVDNFCEMNRDNDKIPFAKASLLGALTLRELQLN